MSNPRRGRAEGHPHGPAPLPQKVDPLPSIAMLRKVAKALRARYNVQAAALLDWAADRLEARPPEGPARPVARVIARYGAGRHELPLAVLEVRYTLEGIEVFVDGGH